MKAKAYSILLDGSNRAQESFKAQKGPCLIAGNQQAATMNQQA
jgi:hypothetical protein